MRLLDSVVGRRSKMLRALLATLLLLAPFAASAQYTSIKVFGAVCDGTTNDTTGFTKASAAGIVFVPTGVCNVSGVASTTFDGPFHGFGQIKDSAANKRGKFFNAIKAAPSTSGLSENSAETAFNGDWSKSPFSVEHRITGSATLGQPTSGYLYTPPAYPHYTYVYNSAGHNNSTTGADGRTAAVAYRTKVYQAGQGDAVAYNVSAFVDSTKVGSTVFLANPAVAGFNGDFTAGVAGGYLNAGEFNLVDAGFDAAGIGWVVNLNRTNATGAKSAWWAGYRVQSIGSQPISVGFSLTGKANHGLDLSFADLGANLAAITLKADQRIYGNVTATDASGLSRFPSSLGTGEYFKYDSGISGWNFVVGNGSILQINAGQVSSTQNVNLSAGKVLLVNGTQVVTARRTGWTDQTAAAARGDLGGAPTAAQLASAFRALYDDLKAHGLIGN